MFNFTLLPLSEFQVSPKTSQAQATVTHQWFCNINSPSPSQGSNSLQLEPFSTPHTTMLSTSHISLPSTWNEMVLSLPISPFPPPCLNRTIHFCCRQNRSHLQQLQQCSQTQSDQSCSFHPVTGNKLSFQPVPLNASRSFGTKMWSRGYVKQQSESTRSISPRDHLHLRKMVVLLKRIFPKLKNFFPWKDKKRREYQRASCCFPLWVLNQYWNGSEWQSEASCTGFSSHASPPPPSALKDGLRDFSVVVLQNSTNFITIYCIDLHFLADKKDWSLSTLGNFHS